MWVRQRPHSEEVSKATHFRLLGGPKRGIFPSPFDEIIMRTTIDPLVNHSMPLLSSALDHQRRGIMSTSSDMTNPSTFAEPE